MKNLKINFLLIAVLLLIGASVSAFTFINKDNTAAARVETTWYFTGSESQILDADLYRNTGSPETDCSTYGNSPCSISVLASDAVELQAFLDEQQSAQDVTAMSAQKRP